MQQQHNQQMDSGTIPVFQPVLSQNNLTNQEPKPSINSSNTYNLSHTPVSKRDNAFKSPAPSSKKYLNINHLKSPMVQSNSRVNASNSKIPQSTAESWMISPVCSRLRDHIQMLNGNAQKERLFLHSPMTSNIAWPLSSPSNNNQRGLGQGSTAPNTSTCQKYASAATQEAYSEGKHGGSMDSPLVVRKFIDPDNIQSGLLGTLNKNLQKSGYKQGSDSTWRGFPEILPYNFDEVCFKLDTHLEQNNFTSLQGSNRKDIPIIKVTHNQNMTFKFNISHPHYMINSNLPVSNHPHDQQMQMANCHVPSNYHPMEHMGYRYDHEMNEDSYSSDNMDNENDSESIQRNGSESMKQGKRAMNRCFNVQGESNYERIIRKRKRKSSDQLKTLMREFDRNPNWSKETLLEVSRKTGLSEAQVYKWGWDQKRKKYGPEIAAMMMVPFDQMGFGDSYQPPFMNYENGLDINDQNNCNQMTQEPTQTQKSHKINHIPFPNEALLEKLSNQLAEEDNFTQNQYALNHKKMIGENQPSEAKLKSALKKQERAQKNQPRISVDNSDDQVKVRIQLDSNEKVHKTASKFALSHQKGQDQSIKNDMELINTPAPASDNFTTDKKRNMKAESKEKTRFNKNSDDRNKENSKSSGPVLNLNKDLNKISLEKDSRKTRSGKNTENINPSKLLEENSPEPLLKMEKRQLRDSKALKKINNR